MTHDSQRSIPNLPVHARRLEPGGPGGHASRLARVSAILAALGAALVPAACGAPDDGSPLPGGGGTVGACAPGEQRACACPGGSQGAQACTPDGSGFGACDCGAGGGGGAGGAAGTGGVAGTGSAAGTGGAGTGGGGGGATCDAMSCAGCCMGTACLPGDSTAACGAWGAACQGCAPSFICAAGGCAVDSASRWDLVIVSGTVTEKAPDGSEWDYPGGLPDAFVTAYVGSPNSPGSSTIAKSDTLSPYWDEPVTQARADELGAYVEFEVWDEDLSSNDLIGGCTFVIDVEFETPELNYVAACGSATITYHVRRH